MKKKSLDLFVCLPCKFFFLGLGSGEEWGIGIRNQGIWKRWKGGKWEMGNGLLSISSTFVHGLHVYIACMLRI